MSRLARAFSTVLVLALVLSSMTAAFAADRRPLQEGWRVALDRGPVLDVVVMSTFQSERTTTSVILKDVATGHSITARDESDLTWGTSTFEASDGSQSLTLRLGVDFAKDGQAMPVELRIGKDFYRALWDPPTCPGSAAARQKLQAAASRLPASMLSSLRSLSALGPDEELNVGSVATDIEFLFADGVARPPVVEKKRLSQDEIDALVRQSVR